MSTRNFSVLHLRNVFVICFNTLKIKLGKGTFSVWESQKLIQNKQNQFFFSLTEFYLDVF